MHACRSHPQIEASLNCVPVVPAVAREIGFAVASPEGRQRAVGGIGADTRSHHDRSVPDPEAKAGAK
jgi:hypothetical protein